MAAVFWLFIVIFLSLEHHVVTHENKIGNGKDNLQVHKIVNTGENLQKSFVARKQNKKSSVHGRIVKFRTSGVANKNINRKGLALNGLFPRQDQDTQDPIYLQNTRKHSSNPRKHSSNLHKHSQTLAYTRQTLANTRQTLTNTRKHSSNSINSKLQGNGPQLKTGKSVPKSFHTKKSRHIIKNGRSDSMFYPNKAIHGDFFKVHFVSDGRNDLSSRSIGHSLLKITPWPIPNSENSEGVDKLKSFLSNDGSPSENENGQNGKGYFENFKLSLPSKNNSSQHSSRSIKNYPSILEHNQMTPLRWDGNLYESIGKQIVPPPYSMNNPNNMEYLYNAADVNGNDLLKIVPSLDAKSVDSRLFDDSEFLKDTNGLYQNSNSDLVMKPINGGNQATEIHGDQRTSEIDGLISGAQIRPAVQPFTAHPGASSRIQESPHLGKKPLPTKHRSSKAAAKSSKGRIHSRHKYQKKWKNVDSKPLKYKASEQDFVKLELEDPFFSIRIKKSPRNKGYGSSRVKVDGLHEDKPENSYLKKAPGVYNNILPQEKQPPQIFKSTFGSIHGSLHGEPLIFGEPVPQHVTDNLKGNGHSEMAVDASNGKSSEKLYHDEKDNEPSHVSHEIHQTFQSLHGLPGQNPNIILNIPPKHFSEVSSFQPSSNRNVSKTNSRTASKNSSPNYESVVVNPTVVGRIRPNIVKSVNSQGFHGGGMAGGQGGGGGMAGAGYGGGGGLYRSAGLAGGVVRAAGGGPRFYGDQCFGDPDNDKEADEFPAVMDIVFLIDTSDRAMFNDMKDFIKSLSHKFTVEPMATRVALVTFSSDASILFGFTRYSSRKELDEALDELEYPSFVARKSRWKRASGTRKRSMIKRKTWNDTVKSASNTVQSYSDEPSVPTKRDDDTKAVLIGRGLQAALLLFRDPTARQNVPHVLIAVTHAPSADNFLYPSRELHASGINIFGIGVGQHFSKFQLLMMSSLPKFRHLFKVKTSLQLKCLAASVADKVLRDIQTRVCPACFHDPQHAACSYCFKHGDASNMAAIIHQPPPKFDLNLQSYPNSATGTGYIDSMFPDMIPFRRSKMLSRIRSSKPHDVAPTLQNSAFDEPFQLASSRMRMGNHRSRGKNEGNSRGDPNAKTKVHSKHQHNHKLKVKRLLGQRSKEISVFKSKSIKRKTKKT